MRHNFKNLKIWQLGIELIMEVYAISKQFPTEERYGLTTQVNRSALSVPSNIAEGSGRGTNKDFANFLSIAIGSLYELETQIIVARQLNFIKEEQFNKLSKMVNELEKMINGIRNNLKL